MDFFPLILIGVMALFFWLFILKPAKARQSAQRDLVDSLTVGQRVMTTAGMFGRIIDINDDLVTLEISEGVQVSFVKQAIAQVAPSEAELAAQQAMESDDATDEQK